MVVIQGTKIGKGKLGTQLMKNLLTSMVEDGLAPDEIFFLHEGVYLALKNSEYSEILTSLEKSGTKILACMTCIHHFKLERYLDANRASSMKHLVERIRNDGWSVTWVC